MAVKKDAFSNMFFFGVSIVDKLEPIFKTKQGTDAARTGEYASNPKRKNTPCISDLAGGEIFLEKGKGVFLSGFCLPSIRAVRGASIRTRQNENPISKK